MKFNGYDFAPKQVAPRRNLGGLAYMAPTGPQTHITENYVCTPPALRIIDETGAVWSVGFNRELCRGDFIYDVLRNALKTGEKACRIEMRGNKISIFGPKGRKHWNGRTFI